MSPLVSLSPLFLIPAVLHYLVATITGSSTTFLHLNLRIPAAMARITSNDPVIPIFTASTCMSSHTQLIWSDTHSPSIITIFETPFELCTVTAVMQGAEYTPSIVAVLISAGIPAPPQESFPAMASTVGTWGTCCRS